jgi:hypothetical protein
MAIASLAVHASVPMVCAQEGASGDSSGVSGVPASKDIQTQLQDLQRALDEAVLTNSAVRTELNEARDSYDNDSWLNEQRAASVMSLVNDVLADASQRVNLYGDGSMMGWSDGFHLSSADGQFRLNIGGLMQTQFMSRWQGTDATSGFGQYDEWRYGFGVSRTQLSFDGHAFGRGLTYLVELGWGRNDPYNHTSNANQMTPRMWDAWVAFQLNSETKIKLGQFMLPFTKEAIIKSPYQMAIFPSLVEYRMGLERSQGVELDWKSNDRHFSLTVSNGSAALLQGLIFGSEDPTPPLSALGSDTLYSVTMRHEWKLLGEWDQFDQFTSPPGSERGVLIGVAGHRQNTESNSPVPVGGFPPGIFWGVTADMVMQFDGASLFGAVIYERVLDISVALPRLNLLAFVAQGSTYVTNQTELFARWESGGPDREAIAGGDHLQILTVGMNHYMDGQDLKFTADLGFSFGEVSGFMANTQAGWITDVRRRNQVLVRTQLQLMF